VDAAKDLLVVVDGIADEAFANGNVALPDLLRALFEQLVC
jgi:hypothetical protein